MEVLKEWTIGFSKADTSQKIACLGYVGPWLNNLNRCAKPSLEDGVESRKQVAEIIRSFIAISISERRVSPAFSTPTDDQFLHLVVHQQVWAVLATAQDHLLELVVAEAIHTAFEAGVGSEGAETAGDILSTIGTTAIRGRLLLRLRKVSSHQSLCSRADDRSNIPQAIDLADRERGLVRDLRSGADQSEPLVFADFGTRLSDFFPRDCPHHYPSCRLGRSADPSVSVWSIRQHSAIIGDVSKCR